MKNTFQLSQEELIQAITNYLVDTDQIDEDTPDGYMQYELNEKGILDISISSILLN